MYVVLNFSNTYIFARKKKLSMCDFCVHHCTEHDPLSADSRIISQYTGYERSISSGGWAREYSFAINIIESSCSAFVM